jgi:outer membrane protein OmpA-like peptidoglycan-associated protein/tetratricopeptide (TPR) repeat protein
MKYLILCLFFGVLLSCRSQPPANKPPRRAELAYNEAVSYYNALKMDLALEQLDRAVIYHSDYYEARLMRAELLADKGLLEKAVQDLTYVTVKEPKRYARIFGALANVYEEMARPDMAIVAFEQLLMNRKLGEEGEKNIREKIKKLGIAAEIISKPLQILLENMGPGVNSEFSEYHPSFTVDGKEMVYTLLHPSRGGCPGGNSRMGEDFISAFLDQGKYGRRKLFPEPVNTPCNEGAGCISADGRFLFFAADYKEGLGGMDLYYSQRIEGKWSKPLNLGPEVNSPHWESQPALASDGKTLYFASTRPGGLGAEDIYFTVWQDDGTWSKPVNVGAPVNTTGKDFSPYIHPDNRTLYFASSGHPGVGGVDLFMSKRNDQGTFSTPLNMGYPLNSPRDERSLSVSADGAYGYYASDMPGGFGMFDLYKFEMPTPLRPTPVAWVHGKVTGEGKPITARMELLDLISGDVVISTQTDPLNGTFLMPLHTGKAYGLNIESTGFLFHSETVLLSQAQQTEMKIELNKLRPGENMVLRNIYFDTDKSELKPESTAELKRLYLLLTKNPGLKIEIQGHTDDRGSKAHNVTLSESRANAVKSFLVKQGIASNRLVAKGYGDSRPMADNSNEQGRALNRRTQILILE